MEHRIAGLLTRSRLKDLANHLADQILLTQDRNRRARISACRRRTREFLEKGVPLGFLVATKPHAVSL